jgi:hypothetical protein
MMRRWVFVPLSLVLLAGCATAPKLDLSAFIVDKTPKIQIPNVCKSKYEGSKPLVAVVNFTNHTTFDFAHVVQSQVQGSSQKTAGGGAAVAGAPGAAGVVWGAKERSSFQANAQTISRQTNAKLSESIEDGVMDELVNMGGAKVFTRKEMEKIFSEQQFQQSGMVDEGSMVRLGKLQGVKYILTGSVNNVDLSYRTYQSARQSLGKGGSGSAVVDILGVASAVALEVQEGWHIGTEITLRILDVESGQVLFSKKLMGRQIIGKIPYPNYDALIGGIKKAAGRSLQDSRPELSKYFPLKGYIVQIKNSPDGKGRAALINIGEKEGLKPGHQLFVYAFDEVEDPITSKKDCDASRSPATLITTDQLQPDRAWTLIQGEVHQINAIKTGQLVERAPLSRR